MFFANLGLRRKLRFQPDSINRVLGWSLAGLRRGLKPPTAAGAAAGFNRAAPIPPTPECCGVVVELS